MARPLTCGVQATVRRFLLGLAAAVAVLAPAGGLNAFLPPAIAPAPSARGAAFVLQTDKAGGDPTSEKEGGSPEDQKLFHEVMSKLLQTEQLRKAFPIQCAFPPKTMILPNSVKEVNAYASAYARDKETGKYLVMAVITEGYMEKIVAGDDGVLAAVMGHELAHITKKHIATKVTKDISGMVLSREQEIEADLEGVKFAVAAGFSYKDGIRNAFRAWKALGDAANFEGITGSHPPWTDRLKFLDREEAQIWKAMAAFHNGYFFLHVEQYKSAQTCFEKVVADFPDCAEGWANLGYARLMQYCDSL